MKLRMTVIYQRVYILNEHKIPIILLTMHLMYTVLQFIAETAGSLFESKTMSTTTKTVEKSWLFHVSRLLSPLIPEGTFWPRNREYHADTWSPLNTMTCFLPTKNTIKLLQRKCWIKDNVAWQTMFQVCSALMRLQFEYSSKFESFRH